MPRIPVPAQSQPRRLDQFLVSVFPGTSRKDWKQLSDLVVLSAGRRLKLGDRLYGGEILEINARPEAWRPAANPTVALPVLFQDEFVLAVAKPAGLPCYPLRPDETESVVQAVLAIDPRQAELAALQPEAGLIHRLDNATSGLLLLARDSLTKLELKRQQNRGEIRKTYLAWVQGCLGSGMIATPIAHHPKNPRRMITVPADQAQKFKARRAQTVYRLLETRDEFSLLEIEIRRGSRHQIRIHLASLGHPILGDTLYGNEAAKIFPRLMLHASEIEWKHPQSGEQIRLQAPLPEDWQSAQGQILRNSSKE